MAGFDISDTGASAHFPAPGNDLDPVAFLDSALLSVRHGNLNEGVRSGGAQFRRTRSFSPGVPMVNHPSRCEEEWIFWIGLFGRRDVLSGFDFCATLWVISLVVLRGDRGSRCEVMAVKFAI